MSVYTPEEREVLLDRLATAHAYLWYRTPRGGGYPTAGEIKASRGTLERDFPAIGAPDEAEAVQLLTAHSVKDPRKSSK